MNKEMADEASFSAASDLRKAFVLAAVRMKQGDGQNLLGLLQGLEKQNPKNPRELVECFSGKMRGITKDAIERCLEEIGLLKQRGIRLYCPGDNEYPETLLNIHRAPPTLFAMGDMKSISSQRCISVVGSRRADQAGCALARNLAAELQASGVCVVSGLAYGIDAAAHRGAISGKLQNGIPTIAVLGSGLNKIYPLANRDLAESIVECGGVLLSQFEPDENPYPSNFLNRNRVIAGLSYGTVVVQATERSGSLATARHAVEEGREVMAFPGDVSDPRYAGSNRLIKQGAHLITGAADVFEIAGMTQLNSSCNSGGTLGPLGSRIIEILRLSGPCHEDKLRQETGTGEGFFEELLSLEMSGVIQRVPGNMLRLEKVRT